MSSLGCLWDSSWPETSKGAVVVPSWVENHHCSRQQRLANNAPPLKIRLFWKPSFSEKSMSFFSERSMLFPGSSWILPETPWKFSPSFPTDCLKPISRTLSQPPSWYILGKVRDSIIQWATKVSGVYRLSTTISIWESGDTNNDVREASVTWRSPQSWENTGVVCVWHGITSNNALLQHTSA